MLTLSQLYTWILTTVGYPLEPVKTGFEGTDLSETWIGGNESFPFGNSCLIPKRLASAVVIEDYCTVKPESEDWVELPSAEEIRAEQKAKIP